MSKPRSRSPRVQPATGPSSAAAAAAAGRRERARSVWLGVLVFGATVVAYLPAMKAGFIWNDSDYVTAPGLRSFDGLARIWFEVGATEQYYPLLHSAFWIEHRLWGDAAIGYHLVNILLHATSACLLALILRRLLDHGVGPSTSPRASASGPTAAGHERRRYAGVEWLAALVFALHPVCVESVAWITEQKNTFSLVFYLGAFLIYLRFDETRRPRHYFSALALFCLSILGKTATVTLPAALLVVFWWRRGRLAWRSDVRPLLPWLVLGAAGSEIAGPATRGRSRPSFWTRHSAVFVTGNESP